MRDPKDLIAVLDPTTPKNVIVPWPGGEEYEARGWRLVPVGCVQDQSLCLAHVVRTEDGRVILARDG